MASTSTVEGDLLLPLQHPQEAHVDVHQRDSFLNSIWTLAFFTAAYSTRWSAPSTSRTAPVVVGLGDPAGDRVALVEDHLDQPTGVAAPVARQGERAVDARGGHLEGVGLLPHRVGLVQHAGDLTGGVGDVVHGDATVLVDGHPQDPALAGVGQVDGLEVESQGPDRAGQLLSEEIPGGVSAHGRRPSLLCCCGGFTLAPRRNRNRHPATVHLGFLRARPDPRRRRPPAFAPDVPGGRCGGDRDPGTRWGARRLF